MVKLNMIQKIYPPVLLLDFELLLFIGPDRLNSSFFLLTSYFSAISITKLYPNKFFTDGLSVGSSVSIAFITLHIPSSRPSGKGSYFP